MVHRRRGDEEVPVVVEQADGSDSLHQCLPPGDAGEGVVGGYEWHRPSVVEEVRRFGLPSDEFRGVFVSVHGGFFSKEVLLSAIVGGNSH